MKATQIIAALELLVKSKQPVFLWGPPGVGKSQVVRQTAQGLGIAIIDIRAVLLDPVDLRGLPRITDAGIAEWCSPSFFPQSGEGILFLDELNAAPPLVQAACYQLVLDRRVGEYVLPEGWTVVAAGNRDQDKAVTHRMPSALANRFVHIDFTVDHLEWLAWAEKNGIAQEIQSFIKFRPALLHDFDPQGDTRSFPSPRSWEFVSRLLLFGAEGDVLRELLEGTIGVGAATELVGYLEIHRRLPAIEEVLAAPGKVPLPDDPAVLFATCEMVGRSIGRENAPQVIELADRLPDEYGVFLVREAVRNCVELAGSEEFAGWAARNADVLV